MNICVRCHQRKGKRRCPLYQGWLCSLCCGQIREKENRCPTTCSFFQKHHLYQEKRFLEKHADQLNRLQLVEEQLAQNDKLTWLAYSIEKEIAQEAQKNPHLRDQDIIEALSRVQETLRKGGRQIILPGESLSPLDSLTDKINHILNTCRHQRDIVVPESYEHYSLEEKNQVIDTLLTRAKFLSLRTNLSGKEYLNNLLQRLAAIDKKLSSGVLLHK